ncbi:MAG: enoyl-CoA hydratase/isomerase family protein [Deltaproteobacteria bacterium]|nr:enoyl-CoA hydratase/isomerase family protein [Deltaproteobacteria bacterium]
MVVSPEDAICRVTISRPRDRNSIHSELMIELHDFMDEVEKTSIRAVVFSGAGETHFIGGADGVEMMQLQPQEAFRFSRRIQALFNRMESSPLVLVAAIDGLCFGGGFEFAMACDLRVASLRSRIGLPEVKVGLIPGGGGTQRLSRLVGFGRALEMILSGRLYKGDEAAALGLVHLVVDHDELDEGVRILLEPVLRQPQFALSLAKRAVYAARTGSVEAGLGLESEQFSHCFEQDFFRNLMREQLKSGALTTSADISHLFPEEEE